MQDPAKNWVGGYVSRVAPHANLVNYMYADGTKASRWDRLTWGNLNGYIRTPIRTTTSHSPRCPRRRTGWDVLIGLAGDLRHAASDRLAVALHAEWFDDGDGATSTPQTLWQIIIACEQSTLLLGTVLLERAPGCRSPRSGGVHPALTFHFSSRSPSGSRRRKRSRQRYRWNAARAATEPAVVGAWLRITHPQARHRRSRGPISSRQEARDREEDPKMMRFRRWGFTLIELLVVIAIIAILAAILFPSSPRRATRRARRVVSPI